MSIVSSHDAMVYFTNVEKQNQRQQLIPANEKEVDFFLRKFAAGTTKKPLQLQGFHLSKYFLYNIPHFIAAQQLIEVGTFFCFRFLKLHGHHVFVSGSNSLVKNTKRSW